MSASPSYPRGNEPAVQLPPGALPPPREPRRTRKEWWYINKLWITTAVLFVALLVGSWAVTEVPAVSVSQSHSYTAVTADHWISVPVHSTVSRVAGSARATSACESNSVGIGFNPNDTVVPFVGTSGRGTGPTMSVSYNDPSTPIVVEAGLNDVTCFATNSSGSFVLSSPGFAFPAYLLFMTPVPATVYVNATYSYLAPVSTLL